MTQNKKCVETQKAEASVETDFVELVSYIKERNKNINRMSDKLRKNLCEFATKIENTSGFEITDVEPYLDETSDVDLAHGFTTKNYLRLGPNTWLQTVNITSMEDGDISTTKQKIWNFNSIPREDLKAIITSGRLPKFLRYASEVLAEKEAEYVQVAEIAEKINEIAPDES